MPIKISPTYQALLRPVCLTFWLKGKGLILLHTHFKGLAFSCLSWQGSIPKLNGLWVLNKGKSQTYGSDFRDVFCSFKTVKLHAVFKDSTPRTGLCKKLQVVLWRGNLCLSNGVYLMLWISLRRAVTSL